LHAIGLLDRPAVLAGLIIAPPGFTPPELGHKA
jgi:hypothetical protein